MNTLNWYRPVSQLPAQAALGVQAVIGWVSDGGYTRDTYKVACRALGLSYIMPAPTSDAELATEAADPFCLGWDHRDEPNNESPTVAPIADLQANYTKWKAANPKKIVLLNFDGSQHEGWSHNPDGTPFDYIAAAKWCDWLMIDFYVRNRLGPDVDLKATMGPIIDRFMGYAAGKPFGFFIETDAQNLQEQKPQWAPLSCGPTAKDINDYYDLAAAKGVQLIGLFEDVIGVAFESFGGDGNEAADVMAAVIANNKRLLTPLPSVVSHSPAPSGVGAASGSATANAPLPPIAQPPLTPATQKPPVVQPPAEPVAWTMARDIKHGRINVTLPPLKPGGQPRIAFITDAGLIKAIDGAAGR